MPTFSEAALLTSSEKVTLVTMLAEGFVKLFTLHSGSIYYRDVSFHVDSVKEDGVDLISAVNIGAVTAGKFFYSPIEKRVYFRTIGSVDPKTLNITFVYKFFFSNAPINQPFDLASGETIEWLPYVVQTGSIGQQLDDENSGVVLESSSQITLQNGDGYFDSIFDTLIWENKKVEFYYWFPVTTITEAKKVFEGIVESKSFTSSAITFRVNDFVFRLRDFLNLGSFTSLDTGVPDSYIGKPKRRIYGKADKAQCTPMSAIKSGYSLTGTLTVTLGTLSVTGVGTLFLSELSVNDDLIFTIEGVEYKYTVSSIASNTSASLSKVTAVAITNQSAKVLPAIPYREKNRTWHIAGHKLRRSEATITAVVSDRQFTVNTTSEFSAEDVVRINSTTTQVTRITGTNFLDIVLEQSISPVPSIGNIIYREPVLAAYFGINRLELDRDFTISNTSESLIVFNNLAEFNISKESSPTISFVFTNGSRSVTTAASVDLRTIISPRDWIRKLTQGSDVWFEVLDVQAQEIILRTVFSEASGTETARIKNVQIINDDSLITVDCFGMEYENKWVKTPSDAVKHIMKYDSSFTAINEDSFTQANLDCNYTLSLILPEATNGKNPTIRDSVTKINGSVFGSLYGNSSQEICFSIVNTRRPSELVSLKDDDILSFSSESLNSITSDVKVNYSAFVDPVLGSNAFNVVNYSSGFVSKHSKIKKTVEFTASLYDLSAATIIAQRYAFYKSMSSLKIKIIGKALFFNYSVNDRVYLELSRLYKRFGATNQRKIGIVSGVKKSQYGSEITLNDMGNIFNRCPSIAPSGTSSFSTATEDEKILYGFILDNNTKTPDITSEEQLGNYLIG